MNKLIFAILGIIILFVSGCLQSHEVKEQTTITPNITTITTSTIVTQTTTQKLLEKGFLIVPFSPDTNFQRGNSPFGQDALPDLYNDVNKAIAYDGRTNPCTSGQFPCAHDKHGGIDFGVLGNTPVLAAASGTVYQKFVLNVPGGNPSDVTKLIVGTGLEVTVPVVYRNGKTTWENRELCIQYVHFVPSVNIDDKVEQGKVIGYVDPRGSGPHLHMEVNACKNRNFAPDYNSMPIISIDPYLANESVLQQLLPLDRISVTYLETADIIVIPSNYISKTSLWIEPNKPNFLQAAK